MTGRMPRATGPLSWAALAAGSIMILVLSPLILLYLVYVTLALGPRRDMGRGQTSA